MAKGVAAVCPQWPDRCCLCFSRKGGVVLTGILTVLDNLCIIVACIYALAKPEFWAEGYNGVETWVVGNHWDTDITHGALRILGQVNANRQTFLIVVSCYAGIAIINAFLLITSVVFDGGGSFISGGPGRATNRKHRVLMLPWLCHDLVTMAIVTLSFIAWAFLSFFVHVLLAILFPVLAGGILGLYIYLWKNVRDFYEARGEEDRVKLISPIRGYSFGAGSGAGSLNSNSMYRKLPAVSTVTSTSSGPSRQAMVA